MRRVGITVGVIAAFAAAITLGLAMRSHASAKAPSVPLPGELRGPAPWPANVDELRARLAALGLPALPQEGTALHVHSHLDVYVDGSRVIVPAGIGIGPAGRFVSPLHTHDATGVIHVESPTVETFTLGEFFGVWGVRFGNGCLGGYCTGGGRGLRVFADGRPVADPAALPLAQHEEIVVAYGTRNQLPRQLPTRYDFPAGL